MTKKAWLIVLVAYAAFWFLAISIERHGISTFFHREYRVPMTAFDYFVTVPFFWGYVIYALQSGSVHGNYRWRPITIYREERPTYYWLVVVAYFLYGVVLIVFGRNC